MLSAASQTCAVVAVNLRSMPQRLTASVIAIIGIVGVIVVLVSVLSIADGFRAAMTGTGDDRTAIVTSAASDNEDSSVLAHEDVSIIRDAPGIVTGPRGPAVSAELFAIINLAKRSTGTVANVPIRGVDMAAFDVHDEIRLVRGRRFEPGRNEMIVGRAATGQFEGLDVGRTVRWGTTIWTIVGVFEARGGVSESELWCDISTLQASYRRGNTFSSVSVKLESAGRFDVFKRMLLNDRRLRVAVVRQSDYLADHAAARTRLITALGLAIGALMGLGAVFAAVNTMYTAVAARTREIATLRALGFGNGPVVVSVLAESAVLALMGGLVGAAAAWAVFDGFQTSTINPQTSAQVAFAFAVTPRLLGEGVIYAVLLGVLGAIPPAVHAAHLPVASALREL